jgi:hypothetical protein
MQEIKDAHKISVGKSEGKRPLEGPRHRSKIITMDIKETRSENEEKNFCKHLLDKQTEQTNPVSMRTR